MKKVFRGIGIFFLSYLLIMIVLERTGIAYKIDERFQEVAFIAVVILSIFITIKYVKN